MKAPNVFIRHAYLTYENITLFRDLNLTLAAGKCACLLGPSGVGKSTLLRMIAGLVAPHSHYQGEINCDNQEQTAKQISYMAQTDLLLPWLTAIDNAVLSAQLQGRLSAAVFQRAKDLFAQVGLNSVADKYPHELSGGMRQRVALVRTLIQDQPIVLMDEPFSSLDAISRFQLQTLAATLLKNKTVLWVTHDPVEALRLADEIYILSGQPATLSLPLRLATQTPRDPTDPEFISHQANLYQALTQAQERYA